MDKPTVLAAMQELKVLHRLVGRTSYITQRYGFSGLAVYHHVDATLCTLYGTVLLTEVSSIVVSKAAIHLWVRFRKCEFVPGLFVSDNFLYEHDRLTIMFGDSGLDKEPSQTMGYVHVPPENNNPTLLLWAYDVYRLSIEKIRQHING